MAFALPGLVPRGASHLQIILAMLWGSSLGLSPSFLGLHSLIMLASLVILRLPIFLLLVTAFSTWILGFLGLDTYIDALGAYLLRAPDLRAYWISAYNLPIVPWTRFNNSMILGAAVLAVLLLPLWIALSVFLRRPLKAPAEK
ncbi:MAG: hypothetical protein NTX25_21320 [Proteobacteria bacterium]|nr:hypothetical protein [Pseudomonadota bacterium]